MREDATCCGVELHEANGGNESRLENVAEVVHLVGWVNYLRSIFYYRMSVTVPSNKGVVLRTVTDDR